MFKAIGLSIAMVLIGLISSADAFDEYRVL